MNEVTKIHLARQVFTISVDAHHELKSYINAVAKQVKDKDVVNEIELRMSELLIERGIDANKVILPSDVDYLKAQLGSPTDFSEGEAEAPEPAYDNRRLFRDTDNGMIAGVAAGIARYLSIDALLVRIIFVILTIVTAGWWILIYIVLWLLVPEAKTSSERLQMAGKPVNVNSLKEVVGEADVKGAAHRVNNTLSGPINRAFYLLMRLVGVFFVIAGLCGVFGLISAETYLLTRGNTWSRNNIFPIGVSEHILLDVALFVAALLSVFVILFGIAIFRRKWPIKTWVTGVLAGLVFIGLAVGGALGADVYPTVHDAYESNVHTSVRTVKPFTGVTTEGNIYNINFVASNKYMVALNYYGHPNLQEIKTSVANKVLDINSNNFAWHRNCSTICFPMTYQVNITVYSPNALQLQNNLWNGPPAPKIPVMPQTLK